jgi:hypothetical protein
MNTSGSEFRSDRPLSDSIRGMMASFGSLSVYDRIEGTAEHVASASASDVLMIDGEQWALQGLNSESSLYPRLMPKNEQTAMPDTLSAKKRALHGRTSEGSLYPRFTEKQEWGAFSEDLSPKKNQTKAQSDCFEDGGSNVNIIEYTRRRRPPPQNMRVSKSDELSDCEHEDLENWHAHRKEMSFMHQDDVSPLGSDDEGDEYMEERAVMEVVPGMNVVLRGSLETRKAIRKGNIKQTFCLDCCSTLGVISDAEYVLCPMCHSLTPMAITSSPEELAGAFGIGLGFAFERELRAQRSSAPADYGYGRAA